MWEADTVGAIVRRHDDHVFESGKVTPVVRRVGRIAKVQSPAVDPDEHRAASPGRRGGRHVHVQVETVFTLFGCWGVEYLQGQVFDGLRDWGLESQLSQGRDTETGTMWVGYGHANS